MTDDPRDVDAARKALEFAYEGVPFRQNNSIERVAIHAARIAREAEAARHEQGPDQLTLWTRRLMAADADSPSAYLAGKFDLYPGAQRVRTELAAIIKEARESEG